jgi:hypothetical protein
MESWQQQQQQNQPANWQGASTGAYTSGGGPETGAIYNQYAQPPRPANQPFGGQTFAQQNQQAIARPQAAEYQWSGGQDWYQQPQAGAPKPAGNNYAQQIGSWYQQYLGRDASQQEIQSRLADPRFDPRVHQQSIANSAEARAYAARPQPPQQPFVDGVGGNPQTGYGPPQNTQGTVRQAPRLPSDPRGWNTDNYPKPGWVAQQPAGHPPPGWDRAKWADPNHQTPKYVVGRILSQYSPRTSNMDAVVAEIARAYPGTRRTGNGDITIPGIGSADILRAADVGGKGWQFSGGGGGGAKPGAAQAPAADPFVTLLTQLTQAQGNGPMVNYGPQGPPAGAENAEIAGLRQQMNTLMQQLESQQQAARRTSPQFSYF